MAQIISASRRTDIPAFFSEWLLRRLDAGFCEVWQPFAHHWFRVSLEPAEVAGIVLWTKNLGPLLPALDRVRRLAPFYVQFTITGHGEQLEPGVPPAMQAVEQFRELVARFGLGVAVWRFDPIVFVREQEPRHTLLRFRALAAQLEGLTDECVISFMSQYPRQARAFSRAGLAWREPTAQERVDLAGELAELARTHGMMLSACCNPDIIGGTVRKAHCVDALRLRRLGAPLPEKWPSAPSREGCGCAKSVDIGAYDMCGGGCLYCYANRDHDLARRNLARHRPDHLALAEAFIRAGSRPPGAQPRSPRPASSPLSRRRRQDFVRTQAQPTPPGLWGEAGFPRSACIVPLRFAEKKAWTGEVFVSRRRRELSTFGAIQKGVRHVRDQSCVCRCRWKCRRSHEPLRRGRGDAHRCRLRY
jgi:hypothetical protein